MNGNLKKYLLFFLILLVCSCSLLAFSCNGKKEWQNPYKYNIKELFKIDPNLIGFRESGRISLPFISPFGIAVGPEGRIYTTGDQKLLIMEENGDLIDKLDLNESAYSLVVPDPGIIYLGYASLVEKINLVTNEKYEWAPLSDRALITSITSGKNNIFVADAGNHAVLCYDKDGALEKLITGPNNRNEPHFIIPSPYFDVAGVQDDTFWVTNPGRHCVEHWSANGDFLGKWGKSGSLLENFCGCCNPVHFALFSLKDKGENRIENPEILRDTAFVTAEKGIPRIKLYNNSGKFQSVVASPDLFKPGTSDLDLAAGNNGKIYVLDTLGKFIRIFESKGEIDEKK